MTATGAARAMVSILFMTVFLHALAGDPADPCGLTQPAIRSGGRPGWLRVWLWLWLWLWSRGMPPAPLLRAAHRWLCPAATACWSLHLVATLRRYTSSLHLVATPRRAACPRAAAGSEGPRRSCAGGRP